jgi:TonB family protein
MMLIGLTLLSAASLRTAAQVAKDAGTPMLGIHEIQVTLRKYGYGNFYAMTLNVPNLNSAGGSWVMHFVELKDAEKQGELVAPVAIREVDPGYPLELMKENVQGTVMLSAVIRSDGSVSEVYILRGLDDRLDAYASSALSRWRFQPATKNGDPVALQTVVIIPFRPMRKLGF